MNADTRSPRDPSERGLDELALAREIDELSTEVCCATYESAAASLCGCKGIAATRLRELLDRLDRTATNG